MKGKPECCIIIIILISLLMPLQISVADKVISAENREIISAGDFVNSEDWEITSISGFSNNIAEYSVGMVADQELSITHNRPDNFAYHNAWSTDSITNSNNTIGEPDGSYTWSKGPEIVTNGYQNTGFENYDIENISLVLHISIPNELVQDEVNILLKNHGPDKLIKTFTNVDTYEGLERMNNPVIINLDNEIEWDWQKIEITQIGIDYVSDNVGADDSEVRVDAVGIRIKYHQPWYSFETVKAETMVPYQEMPVLDFGPYDGDIDYLTQSTCGLENISPSNAGLWTLEGIKAPQGQSIGRVHSYGEGNFTITYKHGEDSYQEIESGDLFPYEIDKLDLIIIINDGCIEKIRIDINDPTLVVEGHITGKIDGLSNTSNILFAIGNELVYSMPISIGDFAFSVNVGHTLPNREGFNFGVATRIQWSSNGTQETSIIHITSISIVGGYDIEWDYNPNCTKLDDLELEEDEGGVIIPITSRCQDDLTPEDQLYVSASSSNDDLVYVSTSGGDLRIQPNSDAYGHATVNVNVIDQRGNFWNDSFNIKINPVADPPVLNNLPLSTYVDLGDTQIIIIDIIDVDTENLIITTSRSWANINEDRNLILTPVQSGSHIIEITVSDGIFEINQSIEVIVTAKPDLVIENIEISESGISGSIFQTGDVIQIVSYIRNQGMGDTGMITLQCTVENILIAQATIENISPGGLGVAICDNKIEILSGMLNIEVKVDSISEIQETDEGNNIFSIEIQVVDRDSGDEDDNRSILFVIMSIVLIILSIMALQFGPSKVKREFE